MQKVLLFWAFLLICFNGNTFSQATFHNSYTGGYSSHPIQLIKTMDGALILAGYIHDSGGPDHVYLIKTDEFGTIIWTRIFDPGFSNCYGIEQTADSGFIIAGRVFDTLSTSTYPGLLIKINSQGNLLWSRSYNDYFGFMQGNSVTQTIDNGYLFACDHDTFPSLSRSYFLRTDSMGNVIWSKKIIIGNSDFRNGAFQLNDGNNIFYGLSTSDNGDTYPYIIKADSGGTVLWVKLYKSGTGNMQYYRVRVIENDDGFILSYGGILIRTDSLGQVQWANSYDIGFSDIKRTSDGSLILATNIGLMKADSTGAIVWAKDYNYGMSGSFFRGRSAVEFNNGSFYAMGINTQLINNFWFELVKTDSMGGHCHETNDSVTATSIAVQVDTPAIIELTPSITTGYPVLTHRSGAFIASHCSGVSADELFGVGNVLIKPNPATTNFTISASQPIIKTEIYNTLGEKIYVAEDCSQPLTVICERFRPGIYFIFIETGSGFVVQKLMKQ